MEKIFCELEGNITPEERGDSEWGSVAWILTCLGVSGRWWWGVWCCRGRLVGEWITWMGDALSPLLCCPVHKKTEITIVSGDVRES